MQVSVLFQQVQRRYAKVAANGNPFPAALAISPTIVVTVLLPLEPVMAMIGAVTEQANKSMSLTILAPLATALRMAFSFKDRPGLTTKCVATLKAWSSNPPVKMGVSGICSMNSSSNGGFALLSTMANLKPKRCR